MVKVALVFNTKLSNASCWIACSAKHVVDMIKMYDNIYALKNIQSISGDIRAIFSLLDIW